MFASLRRDMGSKHFIFHYNEHQLHIVAFSTLCNLGNRLKEVPVSVGQMVCLLILDLAQNGIRAIPKEICKCSAMRSLLLFDNPCSFPPPGTTTDHLSSFHTVNSLFVCDGV
jgi:hypothetical protein